MEPREQIGNALKGTMKRLKNHGKRIESVIVRCRSGDGWMLFPCSRV